MKRFTEPVAGPSADRPVARPCATLTLPFDDRRKTRRPVRLDDGQQAELMLPRGTVLRHGDRLRAETGEILEIRAAPETLSTVTTNHPLALARAAYHLGNRHIPVQIEPATLRYQHDHVLDDLVRALGLPVTTERAPFEPEPGAYAHPHAHSHEHHDHDHDHPHSHE